ncbi:S8 family peptidase [Methanospirillum stamsii]|uniref:Peptidase S8/S53 domain-containing protein n=1 Tax=Methanospirillum stamsii TaxID=1277351 RepID=A0A2V2NGP7_9EURY|nr:S8 family serine peptidase [Methanospirillum stamsii]PWR74781.1 hypothetical protein DLD82_07755 [Methanospirillum stamsii]
MVGNSCRCLNKSGCCKFFFLLAGIILVFVIPSGVYGAESDDMPVRLVVYTAPNSSGGYDPLPEDLSLPQNTTLSLRSSSLGFIVVETDRNETKYITNELLNCPWVSEVEQDAERISGTISRDETITNSSPDQWAFSRMGIHLWDTDRNLSPCNVAVIDTGVDGSHPDIGKIAGGYDWIGQDSRTEDSDGHGTALCSIVSMIAGNNSDHKNSSLTIIPERIGINGDSIAASRSALAIGHAADNGAEIILMGYGGTEPSLAEERALSYAAEKGCLLIASAGNEDSNSVHYPSDNFNVISVGSIAPSDGLSYFSNYGIYTEFVAPGEDIISACPDNSYCKGRGTSFAAAEVTGIASLIHEAYPGLSLPEIRQVMQTSATDLGRCGRDIYYGYGLVTLPKAMQAAEDLTLQKTLQAFSVVNNTREIRRDGGLKNTTLHSLTLTPGWNFISVPAPLKSAKTCRELFSKVNTDSHTIWSYMGKDAGWTPQNPEKTLDPLFGTLVYSEKPVSVPLVLDANENISRNVTGGWNLIGSPGYSELSACNLPAGDNFTWVSILPFNATHQKYDPAIINGATGRYADNRTIQPFSAFWIYMDSDGIFNPSL